MNKITALIPARGGSKGVPKKNIKDLCGHPLIAYSIAACKLAKGIDRIVVCTDDQEIAEAASRYGAEVPWMRPANLALDMSSDKDVIEHFFSNIDVEEVAYIRPTTPLREPKFIDKGIKRYFDKQKVRSTGTRSMHELPESPHKMFKINELGFCEGFFEEFEGIKNYTNLPRQRFPPAYQPNGYLDIVKRETLSFSDDSFGEIIFPIITDFVIEVDSAFQFELLEYQLKSKGHILLDKLNG